jgi:hypothetical protein
MVLMHTTTVRSDIMGEMQLQIPHVVRRLITNEHLDLRRIQQRGMTSKRKAAVQLEREL